MSLANYLYNIKTKTMCDEKLQESQQRSILQKRSSSVYWQIRIYRKQYKPYPTLCFCHPI